MPNRLSESSSPYLRLHAHQQIDWYPWCEEAWEVARQRNVPVFVSLGYAACHWCHVMSEETFDDAAIAAALNKDFVAIKVDREEHADVDAAYMSATQALTGRGGWPTSVFCTPDGDPFFAGTYFSREAAGGMPGFGDVLGALSSAWRERPDEVRESGAVIVAALTAAGDAATAEAPLREVRETTAGAFDSLHGGFGAAPKFPPAMVVDALLVAGEPGEVEMASHTLEAMARGGIHDQLGGGFHRYCVDSAWMVPHFEKMLYDNALLLGAYARGWRRTADHDGWKRSLFADVAVRLVGLLERDLRTGEGAFASSLDADSADIRGMAHEGIYYCWNHELLADALGDEDAEWASRVFHVTSGGTFEHGLSTLLMHGHPDAERLARVRATLLAERAHRFPPARDDKVVAAWNGLAIDALVTAGMTFGHAEWVQLAADAAEALWRIHADGDALWRTSLAGEPGPAPGLAEDYAAVALGWGRLGLAIGDSAWLRRSAALLAEAERRFAAPDGTWFDGPESGPLFDRPHQLADAATPSATSTMIAALRLVGGATGDDDLLARADRAAAAQWPRVAAAPVQAGWALRETMIDDEARRGLGRATVVIATESPMGDLVRAAWRMAPDGTVIATRVPGADAPGGPAGVGEVPPGHAVVCRSRTCLPPVATIADLREQLWTRI